MSARPLVRRHPGAESLVPPVITDLDAARIASLGRGPLNEMVEEEAVIVPRERIARDIVTVHSEVSFRDESTGLVHRVTLVYPGTASIAERRISVLSPVGRALLGRRGGGRAIFTTPAGERREIRILQLHYQPEAAGDTTL